MVGPVQVRLSIAHHAQMLPEDIPAQTVDVENDDAAAGNAEAGDLEVREPGVLRSLLHGRGRNDGRPRTVAP